MQKNQIILLILVQLNYYKQQLILIVNKKKIRLKKNLGPYFCSTVDNVYNPYTFDTKCKKSTCIN